MDFQPQTLLYRPFLAQDLSRESPICAQEKGGKSPGEGSAVQLRTQQ